MRFSQQTPACGTSSSRIDLFKKFDRILLEHIVRFIWHRRYLSGENHRNNDDDSNNEDKVCDEG